MKEWQKWALLPVTIPALAVCGVMYCMGAVIVKTGNAIGRVR